MTTTTTRPTLPAAGRETARRFRPDVEGLRAVAVLLVLAYHAGVGPPAGFVGVDVFFVVSGFVITTQMVREVESTGRLSLAAFYARRAKRLLPAAGLVLLTTAALTWLLAPRTQRGVFGLDIAGAAGYVVNWVFAQRSVDYLAEGLEPSPVLHFWSLAVEEQFYLVWPLAVLLVIAVRRRARQRTSRTALAVGLAGLVVVPSFLASVVLTAGSPEPAFFVTPTRLWEMGVGAFVALGARRWERLPERAAAVLGWAGLAGVAVAAFAYSTSTPWPGSAALLPTVATGAVVVAGARARRGGPERVLGTAALGWVGGLSYSLYLWHWPALRVGEWLFGPAGPLQGVVTVLVSVVPAWLSYRLVETPLRHHAWLSGPPRRALAVGAAVSAACLVVGSGMWAAWAHAAQSTGTRTAAQWDSTSRPPGPGTADDPPFFDALTPTPEGAPEDVSALFDEDCQVGVTDRAVRSCVGGDPDGELDVVVVGDSKVAQWVPAIGEVGARHGWRVTVYSKSACPFVDAPVANASCRAWNDEVLERLEGADAPDVIITSSVKNRALRPDGRASSADFEDALAATWTRFQEAGTRVVAISDTPQPPPQVREVYDCVAEHRDDAARECSWPYEQSRASRTMERVARETGAGWVDMDPWVCPGGECVPTYRNVLTHRQGSHITETFVDVLTPPFETALLDALDRSGQDR